MLRQRNISFFCIITTNLSPITNNDNEDDVEFLKFTSGSISDPKGVMTTHANLSHNLSTMMKELKANEETVVAS